MKPTKEAAPKSAHTPGPLMFAADSLMGIAIVKVGLRPSLIAAAPDLLEAAKLAFEYPTMSGDHVKEKLRAAIAKAEGR